MSKNLETDAMRVVDEEKGHTIVVLDISDRDVLAIAPEVGKAEGVWIERANS